MTGNPLTKLWLKLADVAARRASTRVGGLIVHSSAGNAAAGALMEWRPDWKTKTVAAILAERRGTFIDVGANVGQTLLDYCAAAAHSSYLGFEPNPVCHLHLARLIAENALKDCTIVPAGLGDRTGVAMLYSYGGEVDSGATMIRQLRPRLFERGAAVAVFRLDDIADILQEPNVSLIKIDVEGGELEALRGMIALIERTAPWILCEVLHRDVSAEPEPFAMRCKALSELVNSIGYQALRIVRRGTNDVTALEPIACFPEVVWDDETSPLQCDYLFVPSDEVAAARKLLDA